MRILVGESDPISRRVLEVRLAKWGFEVVSAHDGRDALDTLKRPGAPRLAILDSMMPGMDGVKVCEELRKLEHGPYTYVIMLTAKSQTEDLVSTPDSGGDTCPDTCLAKPFEPQELRARISTGERILALQDQVREANAKLHEMARTDALTQLANRGASMEWLAAELSRARREKYPLTVGMLDIDHFKAINDTHGPAAGDRVLVEVAKRLRVASRPYDLVGRYGDEEFLLVYPKASFDSSEIIANRVLTAFRGSPISLADGTSVNLTVSLGISWVAAGAHCTPDAAVKAADGLLYRAKDQGRNRFVISDDFPARARH